MKHSDSARKVAAEYADAILRVVKGNPDQRDELISYILENLDNVCLT